jgi:hypothetical protein
MMSYKERKDLASVQDPTQTKAAIASEGATGVNSNDDGIAALAYQFWKDRGCPIGSPGEDWFRAEMEMNARDEASAATHDE